MSGIFDQIINYSPPLIVSGTVNYKGTWNASTNTPTLIDPPVASTKGDYYVVSTAGTQFSITFGVGDWIISNGTAWEKVDLTDAVSSVFGRTGAVVGVSTDYSAVGITNTAIGAANPSSGAFTSLSSSSTTTLNGTTVPASKTLVVTTDKLSALAATTSAELAGVISDETGSGALVFANSPTLVTPALGTPSSGTVTNLTGTASININGTVGATTPTTGVFTGLTVNDNTTLGSSNSDTVNFNARVASDFNPSTDNTYDLGVTGHEWRNLNIDGTANIDSLVADTADINGGTIDGTAIGSGTASTGAFTTVGATTHVQATAGALDASKLYVSGALSTLQLGSPTEAVSGLKYDRSTGTLSVFTGTQASQTNIASFTSTGFAVIGALSSTAGASFATSSGNVAIGHASPSAKLDVRTAGGTAAAINLYSGNNTTTAKISIGQIGSIDWDVGLTTTNGWFQIGGLGGTMAQAYTIARSGTGILAHTFYIGGAAQTEISTTGLAVTGALSATADINIGAGGNLLLTGNFAKYIRANTGASSDLRLGGVNGVNIEVGSGFVTAASFSSTGLAVTGALSSTGALAIGNTVATAVAVASTHKVTIVIGGVTYYLLATNV